MDGTLPWQSLGSSLLAGNFSDCPNGSQWIWNVFSECAQDSRDVASVILGLFSLLCFMGASFPQFWRSCKAGNMDQAISIWFLLAWLSGDSCNFVGAFLSEQLPLQTYTAVYYVLADLVMLSLFYYYKLKNQRLQQSTSINAVCGVTLLGMGTALSVLGGLRPAAPETPMAFKGRNLLSADESGNEPFTTNQKIGFAVGSVSSLLYLLSRIPQIITNFRRKSTEGVAFSLFLMAILGNLTYGISVLVKNPDKGQSEGNYVLHHVPWLIGSLGVVCLDLFISFQFFIYRTKDPGSRDSETEPLVSSQGSADHYA